VVEVRNSTTGMFPRIAAIMTQAKLFEAPRTKLFGAVAGRDPDSPNPERRKQLLDVGSSNTGARQEVRHDVADGTHDHEGAQDCGLGVLDVELRGKLIHALG